MAHHTRNRDIQTALVCALFALIYICLRSQQYMAVDGALRCFEVYHRQELFFHGNNHILYPANVFLFHKLLSIVGARAVSPLEFIGLTQIMNCVTAAGCVAILYWLAHSATSSTGISLCVAAAYGLSRAFLLHATNSAEPIVGLFWSFLAVMLAVLSVQQSRAWLLFFSGVLLALAMATYQSMILIGPVIAFHCLITPCLDEKASRANSPYLRLAYLGVGGFLGLSVIYGLAYSYQGVHGLAGMIERFFTDEWHGVFGGFKVSNIINLPVGFLGNILPVLPQNYEGIRALFRQHPGDLWIPCLVLVGSCIFAFFILNGLHAWKLRQKPEGREKLISLYLILAIGLTLVAPLYWEPMYDKLWLQPLACIILFLAFLVKINLQAGARNFLPRAGLLLVTGIAISNLAWAIPSHFRETEFLREARQVNEIIQPEDLVISEWDEISTLRKTMLEKGVAIDLPSFAIKYRDDAMQKTGQAIQETEKKGGQVYFLGVLDHTEQSWNTFLGQRVGLPYHAFDRYREQSHVVARFPYKDSQITLRRLEDKP